MKTWRRWFAVVLPAVVLVCAGLAALGPESRGDQAPAKPVCYQVVPGDITLVHDTRTGVAVTFPVSQGRRITGAIPRLVDGAANPDFRELYGVVTRGSVIERVCFDGHRRDSAIVSLQATFPSDSRSALRDEIKALRDEEKAKD